MSKDKRGRGQPTKYKPEFCEELVAHMAKGYSFESFGGIAKVSKQSLFNWKDAHPEFEEAQAIGLEQSRIFWEGLGIDNVLNTTKNDKDANLTTSKSLNSTVWIFNMKNRFQWRDKQPDEVDKTIVNVGRMTDEELKEMAKEVLKDEE